MGWCCLDCIWGGESHGVGAAHMHVLCRIGDVCHVAAASALRGSVTEELASSVQQTGGVGGGCCSSTGACAWLLFLSRTFLISCKSVCVCNTVKAAVANVSRLFSASHQECCCAQRRRRRDLVFPERSCWQPLIDCITFLMGHTVMLWIVFGPDVLMTPGETSAETHKCRVA